jgi:hypothetical protein
VGGVYRLNDFQSSLHHPAKNVHGDARNPQFSVGGKKQKGRKKRKNADSKAKNIFNTILKVNKLTIQPIYHNFIIQTAAANT